MIEGREKYAQLAAQLLTQERPENMSVRMDTRRDAVVAAMALAIAEKTRRRRIVVGTVIGLAAAASIALGVRFVGHSGSSVSEPGSDSSLMVEHEIGRGNLLVRAGSIQPLPDLGVLTVGDSVRSDQESSATLAFKNGTRVALASASNLRVDELGATRRFSLQGGHLEAHVVKLVQGERFIVNTPDGEVEVHGTVFAVDVDTASPGCRGAWATSTVRVSEGVVSVRSGGRQVLVHSGETWTIPCAEPEVRNPISTESATGRAIQPVRPLAHKPTRPRTAGGLSPSARAGESPLPSAYFEGPASPTPVSHLGQQNDLMSAAMAAERQGQHELAIRKLNELIDRFPGGPLSESARAQRQRILAAPTPR